MAITYFILKKFKKLKWRLLFFNWMNNILEFSEFFVNLLINVLYSYDFWLWLLYSHECIGYEWLKELSTKLIGVFVGGDFLYTLLKT